MKAITEHEDKTPPLGNHELVQTLKALISLYRREFGEEGKTMFSKSVFGPNLMSSVGQVGFAARLGTLRKSFISKNGKRFPARTGCMGDETMVGYSRDSRNDFSLRDRAGCRSFRKALASI
jgi:hypothetical protein